MTIWYWEKMTTVIQHHVTHRLTASAAQMAEGTHNTVEENISLVLCNVCANH